MKISLNARGDEMFREVAKVGDILPGGMKSFEVDGKEIVLCNDSGSFYAFDRRCGHMNAPLEMGTANGYIVTCPLHGVQFDAHTGEALSGPVPHFTGESPASKVIDNFSNWIASIMEHVRTCDIRTYSLKIENGKISINVDDKT
jgi:nitrite reductase/ring-hydroxylating ferredoxin subunit